MAWSCNWSNSAGRICGRRRILDLGLPDMDGFEVLEKLRALPGGESLPVVAYTGRELTKLESEKLQASLARVVEKHASNSVTKVVKAVTRGLKE